MVIFSLDNDRKEAGIARVVSRERLKRATRDIEGGSTVVVFGPVGLPKVL